MMNIWRTRRSILNKGIWLLASGIWLLAGTAHAQMTSLGGYAFTKFSSDVTVNADATLDVVETIQGEFFVPRHGIFRSIPVRYRADDGSYLSLPLDVLSVARDGKAEPFSVSRQGDEEVIQIGSADRTISGPFAYRISYRVARAVLFNAKTDEVYWNATGTGWDAPIPDAQATVHVAGVAKGDFQAKCFTGARGSTAADCSLVAADGSVTATAADFLTIAVRFPKGIVMPPTAWQNFVWWLESHWDAVFWLVPLAAAIFLLRTWYVGRKGTKGRGTIIAEYDPPDALRPTEVGMLVDARVDRRDLSAIFVDLAVRGYLVIVEREEKTLGLFASHTYVLKKKKDSDGLKSFEKTVFNALFAAGDQKTLRQTDAKMAEALQSAGDRVYKDMTSDGYFAANPKTTLWTYVGVGIGCGLVAWFFGAAALFATAALFIVAAPFMRQRTKKGVLAREHALGFKLFLETAERYRLQWQEREGIFEKFLPYAMAFGVTEKWTKAFEGMNLPQPTWFVGAYPGFVFIPSDFGRHVGNFAAATAAMHAPSSHAGGGFGGGGFSGGGFGGGGGGSW